jgi:hypothetical protein
LYALGIDFVQAQAAVGVEPDLPVYVNIDEKLDSADENGDASTLQQAMSRAQNNAAARC